MRYSAFLAILAVLMISVFGWASIPDKGWGIGIQLNYPFTGFSVRVSSPDGPGIEFNIFPNPIGRSSDDGAVSRLELTISGKVLFPVRVDANVSYYLAAGGAMVFVFTELKEDVEAGPQSPEIVSSLSKAVLAGMGVIEVEGLMLDRLAGSFEYGLSWDVFDPLDFSFFNGGIGFHYYI